MHPFAKPSFTSTLLRRMRSLFDCLISNDIQLLDFNDRREPYLFSHEYGEIENEKFKALSSLTTYSVRQTDQSSDESSDIPLLEVRQVNKRRQLITYNGRKRDEKPNQASLANGTNGEQRNEKQMTNREAADDDGTKRSDKRTEDKIQLAGHNENTPNQTDQTRSTIFKIDNESNNRLLTNLSTRFDSWPSKEKERYVDQLMKTAFTYVRLNDFDRAETVLFEILDLIFYDAGQRDLLKAIDTLTLLDSIYEKMNRYLELIEVNKLILNISPNSSTDRIRKSLDRIAFGFRKVNLEHKAKQFIDDFNRKINKK